MLGRRAAPVRYHYTESMIRFALKGLLSRKLRTGLTALAIVLGVAMISGTYVLTDSIDSAFDQIFTDVRQGSDVVVTGKSAFDLSDGSGVTEPTLPESLLGEVRGLDGVGQAEGSVDSDSTSLIGKDGKAIVFGGAPNLGFAIADGDSTFNPLRLVEGQWPGPDQVVIDSGVAKKKDFAIGDEIGVQVEGPVEQLRISGIVEFGSNLSIGGATLAGFDLPTAQKLFEKVGRLDEIAVAAKPGVTSQQLLEEIRPILPSNAQAVTGLQQAEEDASETNEFIGFLQGFLLAFGGIALFVGSFVIANSLSITIAQRIREFATLRTIGASRRQILTSVILESFVVGVLASVVGLFLGLLLAKGLFELFDAVGFTLPNVGLLFETRTVIVALLAGILVTVLASLRPAIRATRVPPIAAVREGATLPEARHSGSAHRGRAPDDRGGLRRAALRPLRPRPRHDPDPDLDGARRAARLPRRRALLLTARAPARAPPRLARDEDRRHGRHAGARQLAAQPAAHRLDRVRADDRPRARHPRRDARGRDRQLVRGRGQRPLHRRLRDHGAEQLLADPDRRRRGGRGACRA